MINIFSQQKDLARYAGPGHWNDPDMLEVGNGGMTTEEYKTHFSLWCMLAAPLLAGNDVQNMSPETKSILLNKEIIALDQDTLGRQARCWRDNGDYQIWIKDRLPIMKKPYACSTAVMRKRVCLLTLHCWPRSGLKRGEVQPMELENYTVRDLWDHKDLVLKEPSMYIDLLPHSVKVYRFIMK